MAERTRGNPKHSDSTQHPLASRVWSMGVLCGVFIIKRIDYNGPKWETWLRNNEDRDAVNTTLTIQTYQGAGHSVGLHSTDATRPMVLATAIPTSRVIVNQAHTFATGGSFTNGMPFSLSMGCGTWGGNSVNENVNYRHFMQSTKIIREIPSREPSLGEIFDGYWAAAGK